nr:hypothetical protein [Tanacetum cinerariifolium]
MSKQWFASQVDVNNNLSRPVTQHYLPKRRESIFAKPDHMIASSESRNSFKNMLRFSSNDMAHNHYLDEARKKTQERDRNSKPSVMSSARFRSTVDGSKPKPKSNNQTSMSLPVSKSSRVTITAVPKADHSKSSTSFLDSKYFFCSTCHKCVINANHDACITKILKSDLRWKPTGRIFKSIGLRWIPIGKLVDSCTSKVDSDPPHGSNVDISNIHECKQTLDSMVAEKADISETIIKDTSEYRDTVDSGRKKEIKSFTFYRIETKEVCKRYITPCFIDGLNAYDDEINMEYEKNIIYNEFAVKLCLEYEVKNDEKVVKRELLIALRGELHFVKFIINPDEDDVELGVIFGRLFLRLTKGIADFKNGILTIYLDLITFNDDSDDDLDVILASIDVSDLPPLDITDDILLFVCSMGKSARNKKQPSKNYNMSYNGEGPSLTINRPLTREELSREELENDLYERILKLNEKDQLSRPSNIVKKAIAFLGSLPVPLQHAEWIPNRTRSFDKENGDKKWHAKIKVVDAYGNILNKGLK